MRSALTLAILFLTAAAAQAQSISVNKGQWSVTQDIYYDVNVAGEPLEIPSEFTAMEECWSQDEEVLIDESMVAMFEGCTSTGVSSKQFGLDIGLFCNFEGIDVDGSAKFAVSNGKDSFVAQVYLASPSGDEIDFQSHILMIGHRTGICKTPG